ncbi:MAG: class I SAM-dependent methyltransferase, partial [Actinomycetota bacterium]
MKRHPIFARFYERLSKACDRAGALEHRVEVAGGARGRVLEVGAGNGLNFEHYREPDLVIALEPEPNMLRLAVPRATHEVVRIRLVRGAAEALPFGDGAVDTAVASLVLCSV